jgi:phosphoribosylformimino-5-aminoimidazole carboxamide ribotide isomerase
MIQIIPAIDIIDGKCVRLVQGDFRQQKNYSKNPLEVAKEFEQAGIKRLHLVDLDGARQKRVVNHKVLETISNETKLQIDFGGGLQSDADVQTVFNCGASQITGGSVAVKNPSLFESWLTKYGPDKIILGADARDERIAVSGWQEITELSIYAFIEKFIGKGIQYVFSTDVAKDGLMQGPSFDLYKKIAQQFPGIKLIASGGVTTLKDIYSLNEIGVHGAIIGKAFYEGKIKLKELTPFL